MLANVDLDRRRVERKECSFPVFPYGCFMDSIWNLYAARLHKARMATAVQNVVLPAAQTAARHEPREPLPALMLGAIGVGSTAGVYLGSFLLAAAETVVLTQTNGLWVDAVSFGLIFLVLLVQPSGIFGRKEVRRT